MGFAAAGLLPFVALAAAPVIIHILSRVRLRRIDFPSLMLLQSVQRERFAWFRARELLLLLLRTLALLALLLALARPYLRGTGPVQITGDVVILLDDSYSMNAAHRWTRAGSTARRLVRPLGTDRRVLLMSASRPDGPHLWRTPKQTLAALDSLDEPTTAAILGPALTSAGRLADSADATLVILSDLQRRAFDGEWQLPDTAVVIDLGQDVPPNLGVIALRLEPRSVRTGPAARLQADIANHGASPATVTATLDVDGREERLVTRIPPHSTRSLTFETGIEQPGLHRARVTLNRDSLGTDDTRFLAVRIPDTIRVLVVTSGRVPGDYVIRALAADSSGRLQTTVISGAGLRGKDLRRYDVILATDPLALGDGDWTRIGFARHTGTALFALISPTRPGPGDLIDGIRYEGPKEVSGFVSITWADTLHPVVNAVGLPGLSAARIRRFSRIRPGPGKVLARLSDGSPFLVANRDGNVLALATGPQPGFTDLVHKVAFVPLLRAGIDYLAGNADVTELLPGDTIRFPVAAPTGAVVATPDGRVRLNPEPSGNRLSIEFSETRTPGIYLLESPDRNRGPLAAAVVNPLPEEGNLERIDAADLAARGLVVTSEAVPPARDLSQFLLYMAAAAFLLELLILLLSAA